MIVQVPDYVVPLPWEAGYILGIAMFSILAVVILAIADYWLRVNNHGDEKRRKDK